MDRRTFLAGVSPIVLFHPWVRFEAALPIGPVGTDDLPVQPMSPRFRLLVEDGEFVHSRPCFDATGNRVVFMRAPAGQNPRLTIEADASPWSLWSVPRRGGGPELLFEHPEIRATRPDPCWRSGRIAFTGIRSGRGELWVINPDGTGLVQIPVGDPPRTRVFYPSWFSDGDRIAVTDYERRQVLSVSTKTGEVVPLTDPDEVWAGMSAASPRAAMGGLVAFAGQAPGSSYDVSRNQIWLTADTGAPMPLDEKHGRTPAWSPVGMRLAFSSLRSRPAPAALMHRRSLPNGRNGVFIAAPRPDEPSRWVITGVSPLDHGSAHPKWSPDGRSLALMAESLVDDRSGVALIDL